MAKLRKVSWGKCFLFFSITCSVLAHRKLDVPGYTRQFIYQINTDCQDFKPVRTRCPVWKDMGFCFKYRREMQHVCNRTCQYCVPGQKQWRVINVKGTWGQLQDSNSALARPTTPSRPTDQQERPLAQILGKERPLQTDSAAEAIANELDGNDQNHHVSINTKASPQILGRLPTYVINSQSSTKNKSVTQNEPQRAQRAGWKLQPSAPVQPETTKPSFSTAQPAGQNVSGNTQVGESSNERHPVVVLMGYELGEKSSEKVHNVLKTSELDNSQQSVSGMKLERPENSLAATSNENTESMSKQKSISHGKGSTQESVPVDNISTDQLQAHKNVSNVAGQGGKISKEGADLDELAELLDREAAIKQHINDNNIVHAGSMTLNNSTPEESYTQHAINGSMGGSDTKIRGPATDVILPISTDLKASVSPLVPSDMHGDTRSVNSSSMKDAAVELNGSQGVKMDSVKIEAGNKHGNINDPSLQGRTSFQKPAGKQVTLTINERPGTGEAVFQVQNSPHGTGLAYAAGGLPPVVPPQNFLLANENEEARAKAEEEEKRIKEATHSIKNVLRLFNEGHRFTQNKLLQEQAQDFPGNSKSLDTAPDLAGIQNAIDAQDPTQDPTQDQTQDHPEIKAQAIAKQIGQLLGSSSATTGPLQPYEEPNYAFISASDSSDWKSLARTLATQLKHVLNHMEDRERENSYEKEKLREQMMYLTQQQMMGRDDDEEPDEDEDYDDDRFRKSHFVLTPRRRKNSKKPTKSVHNNSHKKFSLTTNKRKKPKSVHHGAVKTLSRLKKVHRHPC